MVILDHTRKTFLSRFFKTFGHNRISKEWKRMREVPKLD